MALWYVAKDGNDANPGNSWVNAKLTIGAAVLVAAALDTIYIAGGEYNESVATAGKYIIFAGVGEVIVRNNAALAYGFTNGAGQVGYCLRNIITDGFTTANIYVWWAQINGVRLIDCTVRNGVARGILCGTVGGGAWSVLHMVRTTVRNNGTDGVYWDFPVHAQNCIVCNNGGYGIYIRTNPTDSPTTGVGGTPAIQSCIIYGNATQVRYPDAAHPTALCDGNVYSLGGGVNIGRLNAVDYVTLAAFQAAITGGGERNSVEVVPEINDAPNFLFGAQPSSTQLFGAGFQHQAIGLPPRYAMSANVNANMITNGVFSDVQWNAGAGRLELIPPAVSGYWRSDVIDFGKARAFFGLSNIYAALTAPALVIDYSVADLQPRQWTYRYRVSNIAFLKADALPAWVEVNICTRLVNVTGRYVQIELTLRTDGV